MHKVQNEDIVLAVQYTDYLPSHFPCTGERNTTVRSCQMLRRMDRFMFLECDDDNPDRYDEEQCVTDQLCYCVDPMTGDRLSARTYRRRDIDCDSKHDT